MASEPAGDEINNSEKEVRGNGSVSTDASGGQASEEGHFKRALGLVDSSAVVVGSMIGSGIFIVSAQTARDVGCAGYLLLCWVLAGLLTLAAALCYSELAAMFPQAGGQYVFLRRTYGPIAGFLYGWTLFGVIQSGTIAAVGVGFAKFLGVFVPDINSSNVLISMGGWNLNVLQVVAVGLIALLTAVNCRGIEAAKFIQTTFTAAKLFALAAIILLGFLAFDRFGGLQPNLANFWNAVEATTHKPLVGFDLMLTVGVAMVGALFSCDAWNNITFAGEEVKEPEKVLPKSLTIGTLIVVSLYLLANIVYLCLLPVTGDPHATTVVGRGIQFAAEDRVGTAAAEIIFGPIGKSIMAGAIMISTFGCLNGLILAGARVYYAMARDGLFFKKAGHLDKNTGVPVFGLIVQGVWSAILATTGTYGNLLDFVVFAALLFYLLTVAAVIILRVKEPDLPRPYKVIGYPIVPILYLVSAALVMAGQFKRPEYPGFGLLIILSGLPVYFLWRSRKASSNAEPQG
ncbi:MAG: amino acid permease [Candidatus Obscuribacterales bacterium]|jgi:APA family basic amino acid/polyamine antiporter|nr:amino acid permease [Candidatus Obscuribacterales bacterium]